MTKETPEEKTEKAVCPCCRCEQESCLCDKNCSCGCGGSEKPV